MPNNYWRQLIPRIMETTARREEEKLRNLGTHGEVLSDVTRKIIGRESYYEQQAREENERYWNDYTKNTGVEPKYPIRAGADWNHPIQSMPVISTLTRPMKKLYGGQN